MRKVYGTDTAFKRLITFIIIITVIITFIIIVLLLLLLIIIIMVLIIIITVIIIVIIIIIGPTALSGLWISFSSNFVTTPFVALGCQPYFYHQHSSSIDVFVPDASLLADRRPF
jgi:hypothetical protein